MNKNKVLILAVAVVFVFAAAIFAYNNLSKSYIPEAENQITTPESSKPEQGSEPEEESVPEEQKDVILAPDFVVYDSEGNAVQLSDFSGKPVVINFWATWCGYCVKEMPSLQKAYEAYGDEVAFMIINVTDGHKETKEEALAFVEENGYTMPVYYDTELSATFAYGARSLPATGFITKSGVFAWGQLGAMSEEAIVGAIEKLIALE